MSQLLTANIGSYPRIGEEKDQQRHRRGLAHFEAKEISAHAFRDVQQSVIHELIREQVTAGVDEVTDGLVAWADPIFHFCKNSTGIESGGLSRYFGTNFYYRLPVIRSKPRFKDAVIAPEFQLAKGISNRTVRAVLTGPYTLAALSSSSLKPYNKLAERMGYFTDLIANEIKTLVLAGASRIQIDEPALVGRPEDFPLFKKSLKALTAVKGSAQLILAFYFGSIFPFYDELHGLEIDGLNIDLTTEQSKLFDRMLAHPPGCPVGLGLVDAMVTKLETSETIVELIRRWLDRTAAQTLFVTPSTGLEHLPRPSAFAKLQLLAHAKAAVLQPSSTGTAHVETR